MTKTTLTRKTASDLRIKVAAMSPEQSSARLIEIMGTPNYSEDPSLFHEASLCMFGSDSQFVTEEEEKALNLPDPDQVAQDFDFSKASSLIPHRSSRLTTAVISTL
jgi:hypothetical protein